MDYTLLTSRDIETRYDSLPQSIRDALDFEGTLLSIRKSCAAHHLTDDEKVLIVEQLVGMVLLGFIMPQELSGEIHTYLLLDRRHTDDIAREIDENIFRDLGKDLKSVYALFVPPTPSSTQPPASHVLDLREKKEEKPSLPPFLNVPRSTDSLTPGAPSQEALPTRIEITPSPKPVIPSAPTAPAPLAVKPIPSPLSEAPVIIHKELELAPTAPQKTKWSLGGMFEGNNKQSSAAPFPKGPIVATVDLGSNTPPKEESKSIFTPKTPRVVHYTDFRTPLTSLKSPEEAQGMQSPFGGHTLSTPLPVKDIKETVVPTSPLPSSVPPVPPAPNISIHIDTARSAPVPPPPAPTPQSPLASFINTTRPQKEVAAPANLPIASSSIEPSVSPVSSPSTPPPAPSPQVIEIVLRDERKDDAPVSSSPIPPTSSHAAPSKQALEASRAGREAFDKLQDRLRRDAQARAETHKESPPPTPSTPPPSGPRDPRMIDLRTFKVVKKDA